MMITLQSLYTGEDRPCTVGYSEKNKAFNRFKNITVCMYIMNETLVTLMYSSDDDNRIILTTNPNLEMCQREYVNANYVDVSLILH